ncbi:hypothetical protein T4E_7616, partial [Trichinella pseudospiralis]
LIPLVIAATRSSFVLCLRFFTHARLHKASFSLQVTQTEDGPTAVEVEKEVDSEDKDFS